ncbi:influenza virus NS1A-binding protein homolog B isoform X2 [Mangifera indica]|uniref:influenza virus NS1A-binding protein homolog B isoform X2 n=1 Tax=Mangifera indica TaxID=29780 RepID=UPI001CFA3831|nr:influenza virus NS1A-binding protein homolog B isoform X2 [Mangifera indica]
MGAGRKAQTIILNGNSPPTNPTYTHASARNLGKHQLGGVIFGCKNNTIRECLTNQLFGLPAQHFTYVKNIDIGLPLFLFNYSDRKLYGIYEAASPGKMNIDPYGWTTDGSERTFYPAQVQICVKLQCQPLLEEQFKPVIEDNYYTNHQFWFELDHSQASKLISLASLSVSTRTFLPCLPFITTKRGKFFQPLSSPETEEESKGFGLFATQPNPDVTKCLGCVADSKVATSVSETEGECELLQSCPSEVDQSNNYLSRKMDSGDDSPINGDNQLLEAHLDVKMVEQKEKDIILMKLKQLAFNRGRRDIPSTDYVYEPAVTSDMCPGNGGSVHEKISSDEKNEENHCSSSYCKSIITKVDAETEIQKLKNHCTMVNSVSNAPIKLSDENAIESLDELHVVPTMSIYILGGYDGESWLSTLDLYAPSRGVMKSFQPMNSVRSFAAVASLYGEVYVFGGGDGRMWYNTVESYSPGNDEWTLCPSLNQAKGGLGGVTSDNKIYAIGGGNGVDCFSDVEMFDLRLERWITMLSLRQKRFSLAAAEIDGVLYATGGFDGVDYLNSAEKFDPRMRYWEHISSMNSKRACHSLVVLNGKLYALGGYNGNAMVSSVEIYDSRMDSWMTVDPMKQARGYSAAVVQNESIYVFAGVESGDRMLNTVECFKEGRGWEIIDVIGNRSFMSAFAL